MKDYSELTEEVERLKRMSELLIDILYINDVIHDLARDELKKRINGTE